MYIYISFFLKKKKEKIIEKKTYRGLNNNSLGFVFSESARVWSEPVIISRSRKGRLHTWEWELSIQRLHDLIRRLYWRARSPRGRHPKDRVPFGGFFWASKLRETDREVFEKIGRGMKEQCGRIEWKIGGKIKGRDLVRWGFWDLVQCLGRWKKRESKRKRGKGWLLRWIGGNLVRI